MRGHSDDSIVLHKMALAYSRHLRVGFEDFDVQVSDGIDFDVGRLLILVRHEIRGGLRSVLAAIVMETSKII